MVQNHTGTMVFPETPLTLIGRLKQQDMARLWESSWEDFFDLYHHAVRICVAGNFHRHGWVGVDDGFVEDVTLRVFHSILRSGEGSGFNPQKGRFRHFLSSICQRRVVDFIREHKNDARQEPLDGHESLNTATDDPLSRKSDEAFNDALIGTLIAALRDQVSPRVFMIFELVKLNGEDPAGVAEQMGVRRGVVDNSIFKALEKLRQIARSPEIRAEFDL